MTQVLPPTITTPAEPRGKTATWTLLGQAPDGACSQCWREHDAEQPHDRNSLQYQYRFYAEHDRWPTWTDAMAHCGDELREVWTTALAEAGEHVDPNPPSGGA